MSLPTYAIVLIVISALVVIGVLALAVLACLGVRWCFRQVVKKPKKQPYPVPPGFSLQRLETIRIDPPEKSAQIAAENAFLDALPGLPPRYVTPQINLLLGQLNIILLFNTENSNAE